MMQRLLSGAPLEAGSGGGVHAATAATPGRVVLASPRAERRKGDVDIAGLCTPPRSMSSSRRSRSQLLVDSAAVISKEEIQAALAGVDVPYPGSCDRVSCTRPCE
jgi:hypothetical protein